MENCEICPFLIGQTADSPEVILQTERWVAVLDRNQSYLGKSFVTLRQHKATISDLDEQDWIELHDVVKQLERAIKQGLGANVANWECLMNNAIAAYQPTHVHWHLYPRYLGGTTFGGEDFPDDKWPRHHENTKHVVSDELFDKILATMKEHLR